MTDLDQKGSQDTLTHAQSLNLFYTCIEHK